MSDQGSKSESILPEQKGILQQIADALDASSQGGDGCSTLFAQIDDDCRKQLKESLRRATEEPRAAMEALLERTRNDCIKSWGTLLQDTPGVGINDFAAGLRVPSFLDEVLNGEYEGGSAADDFQAGFSWQEHIDAVKGLIDQRATPREVQNHWSGTVFCIEALRHECSLGGFCSNLRTAHVTIVPSGQDMLTLLAPETCPLAEARSNDSGSVCADRDEPEPTTQAEAHEQRDGRGEIVRPHLVNSCPARKAAWMTFETEANMLAPQTSMGASWNDIVIAFVDGHTVRIIRGDVRKTHTYAEMGFKNQHTGEPNEQWNLLRLLAKLHGAIAWEDLAANHTTKKRKQRLSQALRRFFGIEEDPFFRYKRSHGWKVKFTILSE